MERDLLQDVIWAHLQKKPELFAGCESRLGFLLKRLISSVPPTGTILNIGSGSGYFELAALRRFRGSIISVDPDEGIISRLSEAGIDARTGFIQDLPISSASVDGVVASEVLEHLFPEIMDAGLREIKRVLRPDGVFLGTVPFNEDLAAAAVYCPSCRQSFHPGGHRQSFTIESLKQLLAGKFQVRTIGIKYFPAWSILNWRGKVAATLRMALCKIGSHGISENIYFECVADPKVTPL